MGNDSKPSIAEGSDKSEGQAKTGEEPLRSFFSKPFDLLRAPEEINAYDDLSRKLISHAIKLMNSRRGSPGKDPKDYVCEAISKFIKIIRTESFNFDGTATITTFLYKAITRLWIDDWKRSENTAEHISLDQEESVHSKVDERGQVLARISLQEIEKLYPDSRRAMEFLEEQALGGKSLREIGSDYNISKDAVRAAITNLKGVIQPKTQGQ